MLEIEGLYVHYDKTIINKSNLVFYEGQITALSGISGSGKTSILNVISLIENNRFDRYLYNNKEIIDKEKFRQDNIFYITQDYHYIENLNCLSHFLLVNPGVKKEDIEPVLSMLSLDIDIYSMPDQLSTGQKQRFCLALAILSQADIILCDEITASLDNKNKALIIKILHRLAKNYHKTIIFATHDELILNECHRIYEIKNQQLECIKECEPIIENKKTDKNKVFSLFYFLKCQIESGSVKNFV